MDATFLSIIILGLPIVVHGSEEDDYTVEIINITDKSAKVVFNYSMRLGDWTYCKFERCVDPNSATVKSFSSEFSYAFRTIFIYSGNVEYFLSNYPQSHQCILISEKGVEMVDRRRFKPKKECIIQ